MTDYARSQIETMRERLESGAYSVSDEDAEVLLTVSDQIDLLGPSIYSDQRHEFLLRRGVTLAKGPGGIADALEDRDAAERIVRWIHQEFPNAESNKDHRVGLRMIGELATDGDGKPDSIEWIPGGYPKNYDPAPDPAKMYRWRKHIQPMLDACSTSRDRALIALAWDLGPRPGELYDLTLGRFTDHKYGMQVTLYEGKQGTRSPIIRTSVPYVLQWLRDHPAGDDNDASLWTRQTENDPLSNNRVRDIFKEKAERAGIKKPSEPTPRRMRKSSASFLASQGVSQAHLEDHHGWTRGSKVAARYIAVFGDANDREIARAHGVDVEPDMPDPVGPIQCVRCTQLTPRTEPSCMWCGQSLSAKDLEEIQAKEEKSRRELLQIAKENPELLDALEEMEPLIEAFGGDVQLLNTARQFADAAANS